MDANKVNGILKKYAYDNNLKQCIEINTGKEINNENLSKEIKAATFFDLLNKESLTTTKDNIVTNFFNKAKEKGGIKGLIQYYATEDNASLFKKLWIEQGHKDIALTSKDLKNIENFNNLKLQKVIDNCSDVLNNSSDGFPLFMKSELYVKDLKLTEAAFKVIKQEQGLDIKNLKYDYKDDGTFSVLKYKEIPYMNQQLKNESQKSPVDDDNKYLKKLNSYYNILENEDDFKNRADDENRKMKEIIKSLENQKFRPIDTHHIFKQTDKGYEFTTEGIKTITQYMKAAQYVDKLDDFINIPDVQVYMDILKEQMPNECLNNKTDELKQVGKTFATKRTPAQEDRLKMDKYVDNIISTHSEEDAIEKISKINDVVSYQCENGKEITIKEELDTEINESKIAYAKVLARQNGYDVKKVTTDSSDVITLNTEPLEKEMQDDFESTM